VKLTLDAVSLFVRDKATAKEFYGRAFGVDSVWEDDVSVVFELENTMINLLEVGAAGAVVAPSDPAIPSAPVALFTLMVDDVDTACAEVQARGIALMNGPVDRPWGRRTAAFSDPDGHVWELAAPLA
jgi:catechol 2,3-dioxygenase-like lactoylglutathione lyase family enzyme